MWHIYLTGEKSCRLLVEVLKKFICPFIYISGSLLLILFNEKVLFTRRKVLDSICRKMSQRRVV